ncbi:Uncharacterised protein [Citrobacter koseri]|uniref:Uncharacterized protein n=1 Tax=Citrobacter koseri TaxID=545 RepID=A0A2X2WG60_CITKO|nr:Uncharacterised protein [Citrobacter koseri]
MPVPPPLMVISPESEVEVPLPEINAPVAPSTVLLPEIALVVPSPLMTRPTALLVTVESPFSGITGVIARDNDAGTIFPADIQFAIGGVRLAVSADNLKYCYPRGSDSPRLSYFQ